jgi:hypothetical protein
MKNKIDFYLNEVKIDPKRIELIGRIIYLDGIAFVNERCEYLYYPHPEFKCVLITSDSKY